MRIAPTSPRRLVRLALVLLAFLAGTLGATRASSQVPPPFTPPGVDHYLVYPVLNPPHFNVPIQLSDQFSQNVDHQTIQMTYFMTPVNKNGEGIIDQVAHYTWWEITPNDIHGYALIQNQFSPKQPVEIFQPHYLLNPALKNSPLGLPLPLKNHYKVYDVRGPRQKRQVDLVDQFFRYFVDVDTARFLALPAEKFMLATGEVYPILDPVGHLLIYRINVPGPQKPPPPPQVQDQFGVWKLILGPPEYLCVPSYKTGVTATKVKTWGDLKRVYQ